MRKLAWISIVVLVAACGEPPEGGGRTGAGGSGGLGGTAGSVGSGGEVGAGGEAGTGGEAGIGGTGGTAGNDVERSWGTAQMIDTAADLDGQSPSVAIDPNGTAVAAWGKYDGLDISIWSSRYTPSGGWNTAEVIETNEGYAQSMQVTMDQNGDAMVAWRQNHGLGYFWFNRYTPTGGWGTADLVELGNADGSVTMAPNGDAVATFRKSDGIRTNMWATKYTPVDGWGTSELIETENAGDAFYGNVAIDPSGNAMAVWSQSDGVRYNIWANRYTLTGGWGTAELIETNDVADVDRQNVPNIHVTMDPSGNAMAVWSQSDGIRTNVWANRYTPAEGWGTAELIETDDTDYASGPQVAMDPAGNALAVWNQRDGIRTNIWSNRYTPTGGWGTAELIETDNAGEAGGAKVAIDANGNAVAVWGQYDGARWHIWSSRYTPAGGWAMPELIQTDGATAFAFDMAMNPDGNAVAVWYAYQDTGVELWSNRFE